MAVLLCSEINSAHLDDLLGRFGLKVKRMPVDLELPGSFWKAPEAGLVGDTLYISDVTPVHSALHESCHYICMDQQRRAKLHTDAGGTAIEETATCYLQVLLSDLIPEMGRKRSFKDMDEWGYSYRLGSAQAWFEQDAEDALAWLIEHQLIDNQQNVLFKVRQ
ncbi:MAG: hypothetical protein OEM07_01020 [Gammaproteobacteria bacterium]|nr:hypothetical protein [Gammaproteobacteria bacterium]